MTNFKDNDVLQVEIDLFNDYLVLPNYAPPYAPIKLKKGKNKVDLSGKAVKYAMNRIEPQPQQWQTIVNQQELSEQNLRERLMNDEFLSQDPDSIEAKIFAWKTKNNASSKFYSVMNRGRKPIKALKILKNKGPRPDDKEAQQEADRDLQRKFMEHLLKTEAKK